MGSTNLEPSEGGAANGIFPGVVKHTDGDSETIKKAVATAETLGKLAREAAKESIRISQEAISRAEETGIAAKEAAKESASTSQEADSDSEETDKATEKGAEALARTFGEVMSIAEANAKGKKETKEVQRRIETRLHYLARMYASYRDEQDAEEDEDEEG